MIIAIAALGLASTLLYMWRRKWPDAVLAAVAAAALALLSAGLRMPADSAGVLTVDAHTSASDVAAARSLALSGDGLSAAQWHDLPARPLAWTAPRTEALRLEFPRELALGRAFRLAVHRPAGQAGRLQLLAENGQVLAESRGEGTLSVQWVPPVAEPLVLQARLFDAVGKQVAQGPVPVLVNEPAPLRVQGRFNAPSFDVRVLDELLANSGALVDWQVTLGKTVTRSETASTGMKDPNLLVIDAAWFEHAGQAARSALLAQVAGGASLLVLGADANDAALWSRTLALALKPQPGDKHTAGPLAMTIAQLAPAAGMHGAWQGDGMLWTRPWHKGRIGWLGVADWHRHAISEPQALALWWQDVIDRVEVHEAREVAWRAPAEMPLPGQRLEVCAQNVRGQAVFPSLGQALAWQRRPDRADASCIAVWPTQSGWLPIEAGDSKPARTAIYVFAADDWPLWQAAQRRAATARYAARTPAPAGAATRPVPAWPFALVFAFAMLALWWRERR